MQAGSPGLALRARGTDNPRMTETFTIERVLPESPLVAILAEWECREWGHHSPGLSLAVATADFRRECGFGGVPSVFVALSGEQPVGMARLVEEDMDSRPDLTPWLASVFVLPQWRGRGLASRLVARVEEEAVDSGVDQLYLFTPDQQSLYRRLGWRDLEVCDYHGEPVTIMRRRLGR